MHRRLLLVLPTLVTLMTPLGLGQATYLLQTLAGSDEAGDGGPATLALLSQIEGVAVDGFGNLYLADAQHHRIRRVTNGVITTVAGTGHPGFEGDGSAAAGAKLNAPYGLAADRAGNLYIADLGNARIRRVTRDGVITTIAGGGTLAPAAADGRPATEVALTAPRNLTVDGYGNVYFSDFGDHRVWQVTPAGILLRIAGTGTPGLSGDGGSALLAQLSSPAGLAIDASGNLNIADSGNRRIRRVWRGVISTAGDTGRPNTPPSIPLGIPTGLAVDADGSLIIADASNGQVLRVTPLMQITTIAQPARDVAVDTAGNVFTCSGPYVHRRSRSGVMTVAAGSGRSSFSGDGGPAHKARLNSPGGLARDSTGALYVADTANHRIRKVTADGTIFTVGGTGTAGISGDGGPAVTAQINLPLGLAVDRSGNIYFADSANHRVRKIDFAGYISTVAGTGEAGFAGDNGLAVRARLSSPSGVAIDIDGNLIIADTGNHLIRRVSKDGTIGTVAGSGGRGYAGDGGPPLGARFDSPRNVAVDRNGVVWVSDTGNHRVRRISPPSSLGPGLISTYPSEDAAIWESPRGLAVLESGDLVLADALDARIFRIEPNGRIAVIAGDGWPGFNGEAAPGLSARIDTPLDLLCDAAGNIFFADSGNHRIRKLTPNIDLPPPSTEVNATLLNAASLLPGPIAPNAIVSLFSSGLAAEGAVTQVLFNGRPANLFYVQPTQINLQVPESLGGSRSAEIQVLVGGVVRTKLTAGVAEAAPAIFAANGGAGQIAALNEDGSFNCPERPAARGSIVTFYATGEGKQNPVTGGPELPVAVSIGDYPAEVVYAGAAPGFPGLMQVNARVPSGFAPGGTLAVTLQVGSAASQPGVVIAVR